MTTVETIILSIIEGITEFLPISSTGHMVLASSFMGIANDNFVKLFTVAIQLGAICSVLVLYYKRFLQSFDFYIKLLIAFIPAGIFGLLLDKKIDALLGNPLGVAAAMLIGGIVLLFIDKFFEKNESNKNEVKINNQNALVIGLFQVISLFPGVSRSAATIIGGLSQKLTRRAAAEFSFFLAVPTMFAATGYKLFKFFKENGNSLKHDDINALLIGNVIAFVVALFAVKTFIGYLSKHGFKAFGIYRIIVGITIFVLYFMGVQMTKI